ncbi:hypothetical protein F5887DRAFT_956934 [Amanita rubescens]|nr:hypothetical protein F5887DRAFT_956934 [Amanita rubescens]
MAPPPHIPAPQWFVHPPPDLSAPPSPIGGTSTPVHRHQNPHHFLSPLSPVSPAFTSGTGSNRSSISIEFTLVPPSRPETPIFEPREHLSNEDPSHLSPNSRPISLPPVQSHPTTPPPTFPPPHHNAHLDSTPVVPVLPVLPRVVPQPTIYGTPSMRTVDLGSIRPGSTPPAPPVYEEAPAPFEYPAPLGFSIGSQGGASTSTTETAGPTTTGKGKGKKKGKRKSVTLQQPSESVTPPVIPVIPSNTILPVAPPSISPVLPPVVIPVPPSPSGSTGGGGIYRHRDVEDEISETSFDSATKRNTHRNAQMYGQGNW